MNWGVLLTTAKPEHLTDRDVMESVVGYAKSAEQWGYDYAWILEHHFTSYGLCPDTLTLAGFLLGATTTLRVGTAVVIAPLIHPVRMAESAAMLDQLSNGRFHLGLGRGTFPTDFQVFGVDPTKTAELMKESAELLVQAWSGEKVEGVGPHYVFPSVPVFPRTLTPGGPPIYVAGESPSTVEWAASHAFPLLMNVGITDEEIRARVELYSEFADAAGHDPDTIQHVVVCVGHIAESRDQAKAEICGVIQWWGEEGDRVGLSVDDLRRLPNYRYHLRKVEQAALEGRDSAAVWISDWLDNNPVGTPDQCAERLAAIKASSGNCQIVLALEGAGDPAVTHKNIERFATEVFPKVSS